MTRKESRTRTLVVYELLSLDGVAEEPSDWLFDAGPEIFDNLGAIIDSQDDILLGRGTYDCWVGYWPTSTVEPFASFINNTTTHVVTSSLVDTEWSNTVVVNDAAVDYVAELKRRDGGDIGFTGASGSPVLSWTRTSSTSSGSSSLPTLAGSGKRLFGENDLGGGSCVSSRRTALPEAPCCSTTASTRPERLAGYVVASEPAARWARLYTSSKFAPSVLLVSRRPG